MTLSFPSSGKIRIRGFHFLHCSCSTVWAGSSVRLAQHRPALALLTARPTGALPCRYSFIAFRLLVALLGGRDLLLCAKHLFVAAIGRRSPRRSAARRPRRARTPSPPGAGALLMDKRPSVTRAVVDLAENRADVTDMRSNTSFQHPECHPGLHCHVCRELILCATTSWCRGALQPDDRIASATSVAPA
jgi:hypothetical protein